MHNLRGSNRYKLCNMSFIDDLDARLITLLTEQPQIGVLGASRELGVARGTVQARLDRLIERGVIASLGPTVSTAALGYPVMAFCTLQIQQRKGRLAVVEHLDGIPEVLEVLTITGGGDLLARVVARDNADLQRVIDQIVETGLVVHASTTIALAELIAHRTLPLAQRAASDG